jgi:hypothetical protein
MMLASLALTPSLESTAALPPAKEDSSSRSSSQATSLIDLKAQRGRSCSQIGDMLLAFKRPRARAILLSHALSHAGDSAAQAKKTAAFLQFLHTTQRAHYTERGDAGCSRLLVAHNPHVYTQLLQEALTLCDSPSLSMSVLIALSSGAMTVAMRPGWLSDSTLLVERFMAHTNSARPACVAASVSVGQQSQRPQVIWQ